jgi:hypothetical protein
MMVCVDSSETKGGGGERFHPHRGTAKDFQVDIFLSHRPGRATKQSSNSSDDSDKEDHHFGTRFFKSSFGEVEDLFPGEKPAKRMKMYSSSSASSYTDQQDTMMMTAVGSHNHFQWIDKQKEQSLMNEVGTTCSDQHHASSPGECCHFQLLCSLHRGGQQQALPTADEPSLLVRCSFWYGAYHVCYGKQMCLPRPLPSSTHTR